MFWFPHCLSLAAFQETIHLLLLHISPIPGQRHVKDGDEEEDNVDKY